MATDGNNATTPSTCVRELLAPMYQQSQHFNEEMPEEQVEVLFEALLTQALHTGT